MKHGHEWITELIQLARSSLFAVNDHGYDSDLETGFLKNTDALELRVRAGHDIVDDRHLITLCKPSMLEG